MTQLDRLGHHWFYLRLSLSIGCVLFSSSFCKNSHNVTMLASHAKSISKKRIGNSLYIVNKQKIKTNFAT